MKQSGNNKYDVIVIGAGHNGLTTAALLAKQGRKVLVLERRQITGGIAAGEEFHPGYRTAGLLHDTSGVRLQVVKALALERHGLEVLRERPTVLALRSEGDSILLHGNALNAAGEIKSFSKNDAEQYLKYHRFLGRIQSFINDALESTPPKMENFNIQQILDLLKTGILLKRLGKMDMMELFRIFPMCVADWLNEWFETDLLKAALAGPAIFGAFAGPRSPGTNANLILWESMAKSTIKGGPQALILALEKAAKSQGVKIRTHSEVKEIIVSGGKAQGVLIENGEKIESSVIAASCDPRHTFLNLIHPRYINQRLENQIRNFRGNGTTAKVNLALNAPLQYRCSSKKVAEYARTGADLMHLEKAFDEVKYRRFDNEPILDIYVPSMSNPDLAPAGHCVVSVLVHFVPYHFASGWTEEQRSRLGAAVVSALEKYAPGISQSIVAREVLSPADLETRFGIINGHIYHGEQSLDQLILRPFPECSHYLTPISGLYLCGSGSHPGGGITCGPGALAAQTILNS